LQLYPNQPGVTSISLQYLQALVLHSSSMDSLMPLEIELADRLITHFLPGFVFTNDCRPDSVYWIDAASSLPPARLAKHPNQVTPTLRFFSPGTAQPWWSVSSQGRATGVASPGAVLGGAAAIA
jgi:hypothetical protein